MTEAARRKAVAKPPRRLPVSAVVLWTGLALGTFLAVLALTHGVMLPGLNGFLAAVLTFVLLLAAGVALAELARRHHRTAARHGRRGAIAAAGHARRHGRTVRTWLVSKAGPRWEQRVHRPLMFARAGNRPASNSETTATTDGGTPVTSFDKCCPGAARCHCPPGCPCTCGPCDCSRFRARGSGSATGSNGGTTSMTVSKIAPERRARRAAARTGGSVPSEWGPVIAQTADFEPEDDGELLEWMSRQVTGLSAWAEALVDFYEHATNTIGIDPKASAMLHDVADAAAQAAETMGAAKAKFTEHYELPREFAGNGGLMTHDGRWITGEGA